MAPFTAVTPYINLTNVGRATGSVSPPEEIRYFLIGGVEMRDQYL